MKTQTILILAALGIAGYYFYNKSKSNITDSKPMPTAPGTTPKPNKIIVKGAPKAAAAVTTTKK